jgi:hypothetical protein
MQEVKGVVAAEVPADSNSSSVGETTQVRYGHDGLKRKLTSRHIQVRPYMWLCLQNLH